MICKGYNDLSACVLTSSCGLVNWNVQFILPRSVLCRFNIVSNLIQL